MIKRWRARRQLRKETQNHPAHGWVVLLDDSGNTLDERSVQLWQRGWKLESESVRLRASVATNNPKVVLYDDKGNWKVHKYPKLCLGEGDYLDAKWQLDIGPDERT